jgi:pantetheine-phosphate adenylyltransferase
MAIRESPSTSKEQKLITALFGGKFDPVHNGHLDIARRASSLFDRLVIAVYELPTTIFSVEERIQMFQEAIRGCPNVTVKPFRSLIVDFAREEGANVLIRSMRGITDFEYEADMALMNRKMAPEIESVYLMSTLENLFISGTRIREVSSLGYDVQDLVPPHVAVALRKKYGR